MAWKCMNHVDSNFYKSENKESVKADSAGKYSILYFAIGKNTLQRGIAWKYGLVCFFHAFQGKCLNSK